MQKSLILAWGIEIRPTSREQVSTALGTIQTLASDPRVKAVYGGTGEKARGLVVITEAEYTQESEQISNMLRVAGFNNVQLVQLVEKEQFISGLREGAKRAGIIHEELEAILSQQPSA